jgi:hypothetical protein
MTDQQLIAATLRKAGEIIGEYLEPRPRDTEATIAKLIAVLDTQDLARALERLETALPSAIASKSHGARADGEGIEVARSRAGRPLVAPICSNVIWRIKNSPSKYLILLWSEREDLNLRPLVSQTNGSGCRGAWWRGRGT